MTAKKTTQSTAKPELADAPVVADAPVKALWVEAVSEQGRFRAGHKWTREGEAVALQDLTKEELHALKTDPMLRVKETTLPE